MSYLTEKRLEDEVRSLAVSAGVEGAERLGVEERIPRLHRFRAHLGEAHVDFTVPEEELHSSPLRYVSERYLQPALEKLIAARAGPAS